MRLARCDDCCTIIEIEPDPKCHTPKTKPAGITCRFCRGEETYEQATERSAAMYKQLGADWLVSKLRPISRSRYS